jgi:hypothetical protein
VTARSTLPAGWAGATTVSRVGDSTTTAVPGAPPQLTVTPSVKFVPVTVTKVPPAMLPDAGDRAETVGADRVGATYVYCAHSRCRRASRLAPSPAPGRAAAR